MKRRADLKVVRRDRHGHARSYVVEEKPVRPAPQLPAAHAPEVIVVESPAFQSHDGASERTSGMDRAHALLVRSIPISVVLLVLTIGIAWRFEFEAAWVMVTWGVLCAITYLLFDRQEQDYSTNGLERHRIDKAFQLRREEIRHDHELKKMALEAHLLAVKTYYGTPENDSDEN